jgi:hypothetical protein
MIGTRKTKERTGSKTPGFGKRRPDGIAPVERKPTPMDRLKAMSRRWWGKKHRQEKPRPGTGRRGGS